MSAEFEPNKFIVINTKHVKELIRAGKSDIIVELDEVLHKFKEEYMLTFGKDLGNNKYIVCNQDESYAGRVIDVILTGQGL